MHYARKWQLDNETILMGGGRRFFVFFVFVGFSLNIALLLERLLLLRLCIAGL